jgi:hypothetical protein
MKGWKILRDCRLKGDGVHTTLGITVSTTSPSPGDRGTV